jgi:hypothetical protein
MENEKMKIYAQQLAKELTTLEFPADWISEFAADFLRQNGKVLKWPFAFNLGRTPVEGALFLDISFLDGSYLLDYYLLTAQLRTYPFLCTPWDRTTVTEAVNLLAGHYVRRSAAADPAPHGYWVYLTELEIAQQLGRLRYIRNGFDVREYLSSTGLGAWLGLDGWNELVSDLEKGCRCDLTVGTGLGMRAIKVEVDAIGCRLKLSDNRGRELPLEKIMKGKYHGGAK